MPVAGGEEGEHVLDEEALVVVQLVVPVHQVGAHVDLLGGPEAGLVLFVELPDVVVLDGEEHEAVLVLHQQRLIGKGIGGELLVHGELCFFGDRLGFLFGHDLRKAYGMNVVLL
jgi:hypothetical protein